MKATCKNSANLEQETKTTKIVTYPLLSLASSNAMFRKWCKEKKNEKKKVTITRFEFLESCAVTKHFSDFDTCTLEFI